MKTKSYGCIITIHPQAISIGGLDPAWIQYSWHKMGLTTIEAGVSMPRRTTQRR